MRTFSVVFGSGLAVAAVLGFVALVSPAIADSHDYCPQPPGPPGIDCRGCPTFEDPVVCTVICSGGPRQMTFSNSCFAACSGYIIRGDCVRTGG